MYSVAQAWLDLGPVRARIVDDELVIGHGRRRFLEAVLRLVFFTVNDQVVCATGELDLVGFEIFDVVAVVWLNHSEQVIAQVDLVFAP